MTLEEPPDRALGVAALVPDPYRPQLATLSEPQHRLLVHGKQRCDFLRLVVLLDHAIDPDAGRSRSSRTNVDLAFNRPLGACSA